MNCVDPARLLPVLLILGLSLSNARADGGVVRLSEAKGPFLITLFTASESVEEGVCDVSVLVQRRDSGDAILDATVDLLVTRPPMSVAQRAEQVCGPQRDKLVGQTPEQSATQCSIRATRAQASNKLLYAAPIRFDVPGKWKLNVIVTRGSDSAKTSCAVEVAPPTDRLIGLFPYLLLPPLMVILFAVNQILNHLHKRPSVSSGREPNSLRPICGG